MSVKSRSEVKDRLLTFWRISFVDEALLFSVVFIHDSSKVRFY